MISRNGHRYENYYVMKLAMISFCLILVIAPSAGRADDESLNRGGFQYRQTGAAPGKDDSLYRDLGGKERIAAFVDDFVTIVRSDDRIKALFEDSSAEYSKQKLTEQFIDLSGGPVKYNGSSMAKLHKSLKITNADFNATAEDLQIAMDHENIPFSVQNRFLALIAPMQRDIVTK